LGRDGPGLLLRDLEKADDPQILAVQRIVARVAPDILLLNDFDYDFGGQALDVFADQLSELGVHYPFRFARPSNAGLATGIDLDGDSRTGGPGDAQGFGGFAGAEGMALLSAFPVLAGQVRDFSGRLWRDLPGARLPVIDGQPFPSARAWDVQRLSSKGHWDVPVALPDDRVLHLLIAHATPPVFDGPEDRNGLRNRDEIRFWTLFLDGALDEKLSPASPFVVLGDLNADPHDGEGSTGAIRSLLAHPRLRDPLPESRGAVVATKVQGGGNLTQKSDPRHDTVDWDEARTPGNLRVDYVLPSVELNVVAAGVFWPAPGEAGFDLVGTDGKVGSHHRIVWVDIK